MNASVIMIKLSARHYINFLSQVVFPSCKEVTLFFFFFLIDKVTLVIFLI